MRDSKAAQTAEIGGGCIIRTGTKPVRRRKRSSLIDANGRPFLAMPEVMPAYDVPGTTYRLWARDARRRSAATTPYALDAEHFHARVSARHARPVERDPAEDTATTIARKVAHATRAPIGSPAVPVPN